MSQPKQPTPKDPAITAALALKEAMDAWAALPDTLDVHPQEKALEARFQACKADLLRIAPNTHLGAGMMAGIVSWCVMTGTMDGPDSWKALRLISQRLGLAFIAYSSSIPIARAGLHQARCILHDIHAAHAPAFMDDGIADAQPARTKRHPRKAA